MAAVTGRPVAKLCVAQMPLAEVACRSRQAASKWVERLAGEAAFDAEAILRAQNPALADASAMFDMIETLYGVGYRFREA